MCVCSPLRICTTRQQVRTTSAARTATVVCLINSHGSGGASVALSNRFFPSPFFKHYIFSQIHTHIYIYIDTCASFYYLTFISHSLVCFCESTCIYCMCTVLGIFVRNLILFKSLLLSLPLSLSAAAPPFSFYFFVFFVFLFGSFSFSVLDFLFCFMYFFSTVMNEK